MLDNGGVVALVGPTGVGKTTTIAKMAARFALAPRSPQRRPDHHRPTASGSVPATSADLCAHSQRSGPHRDHADEMDAALNALGDRRLILVDTAGMAAAHERVADQMRPCLPSAAR